ncbi:primase-helicase family protein [Rhizobium sp. A37_96]
MEATSIYTSQQIEAWMASALPPEPSARAKTKAKKTDHLNDANLADFEAVRAGCSWVRSCAENSKMDEPTWYGLAGIVGYCGNGEEIYQDISALDGRYDEQEAAAKLKRAVADAKPRTCENIRDGLAYAGCGKCVFAGKISSPIRLGYRPAEIVHLMSRHVLETETGRYLDLNTGAFSSTRAFNDRYSHITKDVTPHTKLAKDELTRKVQVAAYLPGSADLFQTLENGQEAVNLWKPSGLKPAGGECEAIHLHLVKMLPDDEVRNHLLDVLAFMVQRPGEKVTHAFVLTGRQGTGKRLLFELVKKLFGNHNCRTIESSSLGTRFNAHISNVQLLICEELWTLERRETYNAIKTLITARTMSVEEKNIPVFEARTPDFIMGTSNHDIPITLEAGDRRFLICDSPMEPQGREYYEALAHSIEREAGAFLNYLLGRNLSSFNPNKAPPLTQAKADIIGSSRSQVTQEVEALIEENAPIFWRDLVTLSDVRNELQKRLGKMPSLNEVKSALKALGAVKLDVVRIGENTLRLWAWTDTSRWQDATPDEVRSHMRQLQPR